jgi:hypothetical protein
VYGPHDLALLLACTCSIPMVRVRSCNRLFSLTDAIKDWQSLSAVYGRHGLVRVIKFIPLVPTGPFVRGCVKA